MQPPGRPACFVLALVIWAISTLLALFRYPVSLVGDGSEYAVMLTALSMHASPGITPKDVAAYNTLITSKPLPDSGPVTPSYDPWLEVRGARKTQWDMRHFWFYSLLAWPFLPAATLLKGHPMAAFALLHAALCLAAILVARRWSGPVGALAAAVVLVGSPVFWYANKAHPEVLTVSTVLIALMGAATGRPAWAGFALAVGAAQNSLLAPLSAGMLVWAWWRDRRSRHRTLVLAALSLGLITMGPLYYWLRHGFTNPLVHIGYVQPALLGAKRILTLWVDPDRGLLVLWPMALPVMAASLIRLPKPRMSEPAFWLALAYPLLCQPILAMQVNWNPGASHLVHRYAVWFVPLAWFGVLRWIAFAADSSGLRRILAAGVLLLFSGWSAAEQRPSQPDTVLHFNQLSRWFYANMPGAYDPDPEVFLERACGAEMGGYVKPLRRLERRILQCLGGAASEKGFWAAADPSCTKIYVSREGLEEQAKAPSPGAVAGCATQPDPAVLLKRVLSTAPVGRDDLFLHLR
jgi:hypothetical protein